MVLKSGSIDPNWLATLHRWAKKKEGNCGATGGVKLFFPITSLIAALGRQAGIFL